MEDELVLPKKSCLLYFDLLVYKGEESVVDLTVPFFFKCYISHRAKTPILLVNKDIQSNGFSDMVKLII